MAVYLTKKDLADAAGYTYRQLQNIDNAMPESRKIFKKGENGKYDLAFFVQQWVAYNVDQELGGDSEDLDAVKAKHEIIKTKKTTLEVRRMEGRLVDVQDVRRLWTDIANTVKQSLLHLPSTIAPMVQGMDNIEVINNIIYGEISNALNALADTPLPEYAANEDEEESEDNDEDEEDEEV